MKVLSRMLVGLFLGLAALAFADAPSYVALDVGYRWDRITNRVSMGGHTVPERSSSQTLKNLSSYQIGARGQWGFCGGAFLRGIGHYGWVLNGDYKEGGFSGDARGYTYDLQAAAGYYFCLNPFVEVAPIVGWSYDALNLKGSDIFIAMNNIKYELSDIKAHQRFSGPLVGFDILYHFDECTEFTFGYEFHYANWHGDRSIQGEEYGNPPFGTTTGFSNTRHIDRVYGQVFKLDGTYHFWDCWQAGVALKYQFYTGDFGKYKQTKIEIPSQYSYANVDGLWWRSFAATFYVGTTF